MSLEQTIDLNQILHDRLKVSQDAIAQFCQKWKIVEFALFGSVLRDDFRDDSDLDVLVVFEEPRDLSLSAWLDIREEISVLFGRKVDLIQKKLLKNPYSKAEILRTHRVIYASK
ncbi:nucleotidyltransferase family protein [Leptolyngbya sp. GGD]|jgi:predicted nucleotidyltransferase|uniref:nucleotidyltransferase family protein n=1 Tax=Leptolyngbya sp. GGD TaxID=2997907 RepID=UPI00227D4802|nr:nucleotidyltransferase domain-containing protein [Leptolyngbya sp. GGD]MCY6491571.1 nucleotidyltransferase domain-containing protein [Leptolyngbya sp. GGD]